MSYGGSYKKALTFSFDDGNFDDIRLVSILNKYGLKATFNLNSGMLSEGFVWKYNGEKNVYHINYTEHPHLYDGHEIASHTVSHPKLSKLSENGIRSEMALDKIYLEKLYGTKIEGFAIPFGSYNEEIIKAANELGYAYIRPTEITGAFGFPEKLPVFEFTCRYRDENVRELAKKFIDSEPEKDALFSLFGHSYELVTEDDWADFENFCEYISGRDDIYYCTNIEAIRNHKED